MHRELLDAGIAVTRGDSTALPGSPVAAEVARHIALSFARIPESCMDDAVASLAEIVKRSSRAGPRKRKRVA